jgi:hypothetical protein
MATNAPAADKTADKTSDKATKDGADKTADKAVAKDNGPQWVRAIERGYYDAVREIGEVFENTRRYPAEDTWFEEAKAPGRAD